MVRGTRLSANVISLWLDIRSYNLIRDWAGRSSIDSKAWSLPGYMIFVLCCLVLVWYYNLDWCKQRLHIADAARRGKSLWKPLATSVGTAEPLSHEPRALLECCQS